MRMWMVDPRIMCQKHLCGEHVELHMFLSHLKLKRKIDGYLKNNCLQPRMLFQRHKDISEEMFSRGYNHKSPLEEKECACVSDLPMFQQYWEVDSEQSLKDLLERCPECRKRHRRVGRVVDGSGLENRRA